jgi:uncharacterized membrane protein
MQPTGSKILERVQWTLTAALAVLAAAEFFPSLASPALDHLLIVLAAVASVTAITRQLPLQNVLFAAAITALIGGTAHGLSARTGIPLGPLTFNETAGPKLFNCVPWTLLLLWVFAVFNSRGVARLILRPWRKMKNYGYLLIAGTAVLALIFDLALEPFAAHIRHFWLWQPTKISITWHDASPLAFLGWTFVTLIIMAFITPSLIRKQPGSQPAPDYAPAALWFGAVIFFGAVAAQAGIGSAALVDAVLAAVTAGFCWRGARW